MSILLINFNYQYEVNNLAVEMTTVIKNINNRFRVVFTLKPV